jgi:hypothetical protein
MHTMERERAAEEAELSRISSELSKQEAALVRSVLEPILAQLAAADECLGSLVRMGTSGRLHLAQARAEVLRALHGYEAFGHDGSARVGRLWVHEREQAAKELERRRAAGEFPPPRPAVEAPLRPGDRVRIKDPDSERDGMCGTVENATLPTGQLAVSLDDGEFAYLPITDLERE